MADRSDRRHGLLAKLLNFRNRDPSWLDDSDQPEDYRALRLSPAQIEAVRTELPDEVRDWLEDRSLATRSLDSMTPDELDEIYDAVYSALMNAAPIVRSYTAQQSEGPYPVWITGIEGAYLLMAPEHDTLGPFALLAHAVDAMDRNYGRFLIGD